MTFSITTYKTLANRAAAGDNKALETILRDLGGHLEDLSPAELDFLDGVTAGIQAASKAVVLDSSSEALMRELGHIETGHNRFEVFDDFLAAAIDTTDNWIVFNGGGTNAASAVTVTAPEGKVDLVSGTAGTAGVADATVMSLILLAKGSLVSLGTTVFQARVSTSHITGATLSIGLSDKLASGSAEAVLHTVKSEAIADDGLTVDDAVTFCQDSEATTPSNWYCTSENGGTIAHVAAAVGCISGVAAVVNTYQVLRIEIDATGDARFYIDGTLVHTETTAVATDALLIPYIAATAEDGTPVSTTLSVDYVGFSGARPSSNA